jgi:hypothetical protein
MLSAATQRLADYRTHVLLILADSAPLSTEQMIGFHDRTQKAFAAGRSVKECVDSLLPSLKSEG